MKSVKSAIKYLTTQTSPANEETASESSQNTSRSTESSESTDSEMMESPVSGQQETQMKLEVLPSEDLIDFQNDQGVKTPDEKAGVKQINLTSQDTFPKSPHTTPRMDITIGNKNQPEIGSLGNVTNLNPTFQPTNLPHSTPFDIPLLLLEETMDQDDTDVKRKEESDPMERFYSLRTVSINSACSTE